MFPPKPGAAPQMQDLDKKAKVAALRKPAKGKPPVAAGMPGMGQQEKVQK